MEMNSKGNTNDGFEDYKDEDPKTPASKLPPVARPKQLTAEERREKFHILKNIIIISTAFFLLFSSFQSMANLQSSINPGSGTIALAVLYAALVVSCAFIPTLLIKKLTVKWTMALCVLGYSSYIAAQFYPRHFTLIPTAIILGLGAAPMWSSKCTYLTQVGKRYGEIVGENSEVIITRFFGLFFLFFQSSQVIGNLISSTVLSQGESPRRTEEQLQLCGVNFCPHHNLSSGNVTTIDPPEQSKIYTMASIYLVLSLLASVIIASFVDPLTRFVDETKDASSTGKSGLQLLVATFNHMRHPFQLLIIPLTIWSGVEQGYIGADYTAAYVSCGLGVHMVGYTMICFGVCDAICSISFTPLVKIVGRLPVFTLAAILNAAAIIIMFTWRPTPDNLAMFFIVPALWGTADAVWQTQINALYGVIFPGESEAAFSNYRLWESIGYIINYATHSSLCNTDKLFIVVGFLVIGMIGYYIVELIDRMNWLPKNERGIAKPIDKICS
ncbi:UNC93-like protein [Hyalella azteca]|uniref:UNC93-like protein n=1 Tax=Hyalella azteca TaxID=294128 RepID=A0A8B7NAI0_HYAAZ|nr:UNC93-like protein [Hyalella azteca]